jgi:hypothetical protein
MGSCNSYPDEEPRPSTSKVEQKPFLNVKEALGEQHTTSQLVAFLKTTNHTVLNSHISTYLLFYIQTDKRIQIYRSGQKCGDDKEKGEEILAQWSQDILSQFGSLSFILDGQVSLNQCVKEYATEIDAFQPYAEKALQYVQKYLESFK